MFKFLKEKIHESISKISKKIEEDAPEEEVERVVEEEKSAEKEEVKEEVVEEKEEEKVEEKKSEEPKGEEKPEEGEEKAGLFGKFKKFFKKEEDLEEVEEEKPEEEEKTLEEKAKEKKEERERFLAEIKKDVSKKEEVGKKEEVEVKKKEEIEKKIKEKIEAGKVPSLRDLIARKEALKPKEEIKPEEKLKVKEAKVEKPKPEVKEKPAEDIIKSIAAGKKIEEVPKKAEVKEEKIEEVSKKEEIKEEVVEDIGTKVPEPSSEGKKGFFGRLKEKIITKKISEKQFDELFWELEVALLENNVAVEVIEKIKNDLKISLLEKPVLRNRVNETVVDSLKGSIQGLFDVEQVNVFQKMEKKKPLIICFVGINGSGKTTTIAKVAALLQKYKFNSVIAASDTFRAAAIDQLQEHASNLGIKMIKHDYGSDPAAVAFDAIKYAESKGLDAVLIDTAGRLHSNINLMDEMKKIVRVAKPDLKIFVGESITGNDCVEQAKHFNEAIGVDGIILSKADVDEKGGAAISVSYVTKKPIMYLGTGQKYEDLEEFDSEKIMQTLGL